MFDATRTLLETRSRNPDERSVVLALTRPMTAKQLGKRLAIDVKRSSALLDRIHALGLVRPLNSFARSSRLYVLTRLGVAFCQDISGQQPPTLPRLNWGLYGSLCFSHRSAVFLMLSITLPMQPAQIKRRLRIERPKLRISSNNVRDVIAILEGFELIERVYIRKKAHPRFVLSKKGVPYQRMLKLAEGGF